MCGVCMREYVCIQEESSNNCQDYWLNWLTKIKQLSNVLLL